jgi:outer membrane autotransporter protein
MYRRIFAACPRLTAPGMALLLAAVGIAPPAHAANPELQAFFFDVCASPSGLLATRCAETVDGLGDLSSDSESSLNPSQTLSAASAARTTARVRGREARERGEGAHGQGEASGSSGAALDLGPLSLLVNGRFLSEEQSRRVDLDAERGYRLDAWGAQLGVDRRFGPGFVAGAMVTWETSELEYDRERPGTAFTPVGRAGTVDQDSLGAAVFANWQLGPRGYLDLSAGYIDSDYTVQRNAVFQESTRQTPQTLVQTRASPGGDETWAALALGYAATVAAWNVSPFLGLTYSRARVDGYDERDLSGSGLALSVDGVTARSLLGQAGVRISRPLSRPGYVLLPQVSLEYVREFERDGATSRSAFQLDQAGNRLSLEGDRRDGDFFDVGLGLVVLLPNGWMPFFEWQTTLGHDDIDRDRIAVGLRVEL